MTSNTPQATDEEQAVPTDHAGMEVIGYDECLRLAASEPVGRVAFMSDGDPIILPVNHTLVDHFVVFRTITGTKLSAVEMGQPIAFEVDSYDAETRGGWSVLFRGKADELDSDDVRDLDLLAWVSEPVRDRFVRIRPDTVTGRRILGTDTG